MNADLLAPQELVRKAVIEVAQLPEKELLIVIEMVDSLKKQRARPNRELAAHIVRPGGTAFLWKGSSYEEEMESSRKSWERSWSLDRVIPIPEGVNVVAVFKRL